LCPREDLTLYSGNFQNEAYDLVKPLLTR